MPIGVERATKKPHADMIWASITTQGCVVIDVDMHIHKASIVATLLTPIEIYQISERQE